MPPKKKRRASIRRNLILVGGLVLVAALAVAIAATLNRDPRLVLNEDPALDLARRTSPDNAHAIIAQALGNVPAPEAPVRRRDRWEWRDVEWYAGTEPPMALVGMEAADPSGPEWTGFVEAMRAALGQLRPALEKPYYLLNPPVAMSPWERMDIGFEGLGLRLVALGGWELAADPASDAGIQTLVDTIRLSRLVAEDRGMRPEDPGVEGVALAMLRAHAQAHPNPAALARMAQALDAIGPPHPDRMRLIENLWRMLDNTLAQRRSAQDFSTGRRLAMRFLLNYWQETADWILANQEDLRGFIQGPPRPFFEFLESQDFRWGDEERRWGPRYGMWRLIRAEAAVAAQYEGTRIALALLRYRAEQGALPETLEALVPAYLGTVPMDPLSGAAFVYRVTEGRGTLYSLGENGVDDNGDARRDGPLLRIPQ